MTGISTSNRRAGSPSLNVELGHPIKTKEDAETEAEKIRTQIREGTFIRAAERRQQAAAPVADTTEAVTLDVFAKRAWTNACARAGIDDLHFHDLRHEAGSRLLEAGWSIHHLKEMLGHANLSQTSTYLNAGPMGLQDSMQRFDPSRCNPVATDAKQEPQLD